MIPHRSGLWGFAILLLTSLSLYGERTFRPVDEPPESRLYYPTTSESLKVSPLRYTFEDEVLVIKWDPSSRYYFQNLPLVSYCVKKGMTPRDMRPYKVVYEPELTIPLEEERGAYYEVWAMYGVENFPHRQVRDVRRDGIPVITFDEGDNYLLESYSPQEDRQPQLWEITDREAYGGSNRSLRLYGNTWKRLSIERRTLTDSTVWQVAILSLDGDTSAELQGFGVSNGRDELIYTFYGRETRWEHAWMIANQESRPRARWQLFRLNLGYDWTVRYGTRPSITQLIFINDNDTTNPPAQIFFDEITDITQDVPIQPRVRFRWWREDITDGGYEVIGFRAMVEPWEWEGYRLIWDFGDGGSGQGWEVRHRFDLPGVFTVGLKVFGPGERIAHISSPVEIGALRFPQRVLLAFSGDVMLARRYEEPGGIISRLGPEAVFARIAERTRQADIFTINLESPLTDEGTPHPTKDIVFRGRPDNVAGLRFAGVDVATLANNHVSDYGDRGLEETVEVLRAAGILSSGAGMNEYQALQPAFITHNGIRIGFLAFCNRTERDYNARPYLDAGYDKAGFAYFSADNLVRTIPQIKAACDYLVVAVHGGWEYANAPFVAPEYEGYPPWSEERLTYSPSVDSATRALEHLAIELGADLIVGHHPHVLQGWENYRGALIAHSLGNFAFDQNFWETWPSALWWVRIGREGVVSSEIEPVFIDNYLPTPARGGLARAIIRRIASYSRPLDAMVVPDLDRGVGVVVIDPQLVRRLSEDRRVPLSLRYIPSEQVYRSPPIKVEGDGFLQEIVAITPGAVESRWRVRFGREILWVGSFEPEGAEVWNWNSAYEGRDSVQVRSGRFSAFLRRNANQQDVVTDLIQRIPLNIHGQRLTFGGWIRLQNARQAALAVRCYRYRYDSQPQNILGDLVVERRYDGDRDWTFLWQDLELPQGTNFINPRWQLYGPANGTGWMWVDELFLIAWEEWEEWSPAGIPVDLPNDFSYIQIERAVPGDRAEVIYRTQVLSVDD